MGSKTDEISQRLHNTPSQDAPCHYKEYCSLDTYDREDRLGTTLKVVVKLSVDLRGYAWIDIECTSRISVYSRCNAVGTA